MVISNQLRPRIPAFLNIIAKIGENPGLSGALPPDKPDREVRYIPFRHDDFKLPTPHIAGSQPATSQNTFRVMLGATRVIYPEGAAGAQLSVSNPQDRPMLVQSSVTGEDHKTPAPFLVTPPLFRLEANQQSRLRIIRTGSSLPQTQESLYWLCVKALPPSGDASGHATGVSMTVNMAISMCDKLIFRPSGLKGSPEEAAGALTWARMGKVLRVSNPTPFYMNLKAVSVGGKEVGNLTYVSPQGSLTLPLPAGAAGAVKWSVINDFGGESRQFEAAAE